MTLQRYRVENRYYSLVFFRFFIFILDITGQTVFFEVFLSALFCLSVGFLLTSSYVSLQQLWGNPSQIKYIFPATEKEAGFVHFVYQDSIHRSVSLVQSCSDGFSKGRVRASFAWADLQVAGLSLTQTPRSTFI